MTVISTYIHIFEDTPLRVHVSGIGPHVVFTINDDAIIFIPPERVREIIHLLQEANDESIS
jgi:hypothetical protein